MPTKNYNNCPVCDVGYLKEVYGGLPFNIGKGKDKLLRCQKCGLRYVSIRCEHPDCHENPPYLCFNKLETTLTDAKLYCALCHNEFSYKTLVGSLALVAPVLIGFAAAITILKEVKDHIDIDLNPFG